MALLPVLSLRLCEILTRRSGCLCRSAGDGRAWEDRIEPGPIGRAPVRGALTGGTARGLGGARGAAREWREDTGPPGRSGACFPGSESVRRRSRPRSQEPCAQVRILLEAQVKAILRTKLLRPAE